MNFSRPGGTHAGAGGYPALKRRANVGLSRWDEGGRFAWPGARSWAMTEIKWGRTPSTLRSSPTAEDRHSLPSRSNSPRRNAVKTGAKTGAFRIINLSRRSPALRDKGGFRYSFWDGRHYQGKGRVSKFLVLGLMYASSLTTWLYSSWLSICLN